MKSRLIVLCFLYFLNCGYSQCGLTGMLPEILQNSSFPIQNVSGTNATITILNGNYPTTIGVDDSGGSPGNAKLFSANESGIIISSTTTQLGVYDVRINNSKLGCIDTVEVAW